MSTEPNLTSHDIVRAATNDPAMSTASFKLGERSFPIVDLPYDDYIKFLAFLQPLFDAFATALSGRGSVGDTLTASDLLKYCASSLPEMVLLMCRQTDKDMTADEVKRLGRNPFVLANAVLAQVTHNSVIEDIKSFFEQITAMMRRE